MTVKEFTILVENLLAKGETEAALTLLKTFVDPKDDELRHQIVLLSGQYYDIVQNQQLGLGEDPIKINRINLTLISINSSIAKRFGNETIDSRVQAALSDVKTGPNMRKKSIPMLWLKIAGGLSLIFILAYFLSPKNQKDSPSSESERAKVENSPAVQQPVSSDASSTSTPRFTAPSDSYGEGGIHIEAKAKFRDLELLETIYFADAGKLILRFKYHCAYENTGGCAAFDNNFAFKIGEKEYPPTASRIYGIPSSIISANSDGMLEFETNKVPKGTQKVEFMVGEYFMAVTEILKNPMTIPIDLTKKSDFRQKHIVINLDSEKKLLGDKILGAILLYSLVAMPESNTHIKLKAHILKKTQDDFHNKCLRIIADNSWYCQAEVKELERLSNGVELEATFLVPRTAKTLELMLDKCETKNPVKIPLSFF